MHTTIEGYRNKVAVKLIYIFFHYCFMKLSQRFIDQIYVEVKILCNFTDTGANFPLFICCVSSEQGKKSSFGFCSFLCSDVCLCVIGCAHRCCVCVCMCVCVCACVRPRTVCASFYFVNE